MPRMGLGDIYYRLLVYVDVLYGIYWKRIFSFWDAYLRRDFVRRTPTFVGTSQEGPLSS